MKKMYLLFLAMTIILPVMGQKTTISWTGTVSSDWNVAGNWSPPNVPQPSDNVSISIPSPPHQPVITGTVSPINDLTIEASHSLTISGSLTVNGTFTHTGVVNVNASGSLHLYGSLTVNTGSSITVDGSLIFDGASGVFTGNASITGSASGSVSVSSTRTLHVDGNLTVSTTFSHSGIINVYASRTMTVNGSFTSNSGSSINVSTTGSGGIFCACGTFTHNSGSSITVSSGGIFRFGGSSGNCCGSATINGSGSVEVSSGRTLDVDGSLTVNTSFSHSGIINVKASRTLTVNGSFTSSSGSSINISTSGSGGVFVANGSFTHNSSSSITISSNGILRFGSTTGSFSGSATVSGTGTLEVAAGRTLDINGALTVNTTFDHSGIINVNSSHSLEVSGAMTLKTNSHLNVKGGGVFTAHGTINADIDSFFDVFTEVSVDGDFEEEGNFNASVGSHFDIHGNMHVAGSGSLNVSGTATLYSGSSTTVDGSVTASAGGTITLKADATGNASLVCGAGGTCSGSFQVEVYLSRDTWHYFSSPVSGTTAYVFTGDYLQYYDEPSHSWIYIITNDPLEDMKGFAVWKPASSGTMETCSGSLHNGNMGPHILTRTYYPSAPPPPYDGWNMIGNPYPSGLNLQVSGGWSWSHVTQTAYYWDGNWHDPDHPEIVGRYASYTWGSNPVGINGGTEHVPPMQGFFVHCTATPPETGYYEVNNLARENYSQQYWKSEPATGGSNLLKLTANRNALELDEIVLRFVEGSTNAFDDAFDAYKMFGNQVLQLYSKTADNQKTAVNSLPVFADLTAIPVGLKVADPGTYTLNAGNITSFTEGCGILLEDLKTGAVQDLTNDSTYTFIADTTDDPDRFVILFMGVYYTGTGQIKDPGSVKIYSYGQTVFIQPGMKGVTKGTVLICDMLGRKVLTGRMDDSPVTRVVTNLPAGNYIVNVITSDRSVSQKVYLH
jgi:hypothetical protein